VRELRNAMERAAIMTAGDEVRGNDLDFLHAGRDAPPAERSELVAEVRRHERDLILAALERNRWRMARTARELKLERSHLYKKMKSLGIERPDDD